MTEMWKREDRRNRMFAFAYVLLLGILTAVFFDYYFDLNDDVLMKDMISGAYAGIPSGYNIQMLYPISAILSWFYKIMPNVSWYALFLWGSQFFCFFLIAKRSLVTSGTILKKCTILLLQGCLVIGLMLQEIIYVQYTITSALLAGTAVFLFYTTPMADTGSFWKKNIMNIVLLILAFQIRTEMLLLVLPLVGVAGVCKWSREREPNTGICSIFTKTNLVKYGGLIGAIGVGMLLSSLVSNVAYGDTEWKTFQRFFDARTSIYDFYGIPNYEEHEAFYDEIGVEQSQYQLLKNYNFGLDNTIDADTLERIAEYAKKQYEQEHPFGIQIKTAIRMYVQKIMSMLDAPWNICVVAAYILVLAFAFINADKKFWWQVPLLIFTRTGLWLYILYRERTPPRILHSLYLVEFLLLMAFLFLESKKIYHKRIAGIAGMVLCICAAVYIPSMWSSVSIMQKERENIYRDYLALRSYCMNQKENYYLLDVYSTVDFSEKMFVNVDNSMKNYDIMGGWASKSPIHHVALANYGFTNIEEDLYNKTNLYFISETNHMDGWMERYYANKGIEIEVISTEQIPNTIQKELMVYQIQIEER